MKRSEINGAIERAIGFFESMRFPLPCFAFWTPDEWAKKGPEYDEIRRARLGWDVTDFGQGSFPRIGRTIFTLRNGLANDRRYTKSYAQKAMCLAEAQKSPVHYHKSKMEDIINQGGGNICMSLWQAAPDNSLSEQAFDMSMDGKRRTITAGETIRIKPGESITVAPRTFHQFWAEERQGTTLSMEISSICDDMTDNFFLRPGDRFPHIEEDEPPRHLLCTEYPENAEKNERILTADDADGHGFK